MAALGRSALGRGGGRRRRHPSSLSSGKSSGSEIYSVAAQRQSLMNQRLGGKHQYYVQSWQNTRKHARFMPCGRQLGPVHNDGAACLPSKQHTS